MYDCKKCPGYCCSYPLIALDKRDVERLAKHFGLSFEKAKAKFTVERWGHKYSMRRKADFTSAAPAASSIRKSAGAPSTRRGPPPAEAIREAAAATTTSCPSSGVRRRIRSS